MIISNNSSSSGHSPGRQRLNEAREKGFSRLLPPLPLFALQPLFTHIVSTIARKHPELFERLEDSAKKDFLIDPTNLPFFLLLQPDPQNPRLKAYNRRDDVAHDVYISGTFATLLRMIDAQTDSDALFFNREINVTGDSEAMVALRNALDDMEGTLAEDVAACFGPFKAPVRSIMNSINNRDAAKGRYKK